MRSLRQLLDRVPAAAGAANAALVPRVLSLAVSTANAAVGKPGTDTFTADGSAVKTQAGAHDDDVRMAHTTFATTCAVVCTLARGGALEGAATGSDVGLEDSLTEMLGAPHPLLVRKMAVAAWAQALHSHVCLGCGWEASGSEGVPARVGRVVEAVAGILVESESLVAGDLVYLDALLRLLATGMASGEGAIGEGGKRVLQALGRALIRTWRAGDASHVFGPGVQRLNNACRRPVGAGEGGGLAAGEVLAEMCGAVAALAQELVQGGAAGPGGETSGAQAVVVCKALLQLGQGSLAHQHATACLVEAACESCLRDNGWLVYRVARAAMVEGYPDLAARLLQRISAEHALTSGKGEWVKTMACLAEAEQLLARGSAGREGVGGHGRVRGGSALAVVKLEEAEVLMRVVAVREEDLRLPRHYVRTRVRSLESMTGLRAAVWEWLTSVDAGEGDGEGGGRDDALLTAVKAMEEVVAEIRALARFRLDTDGASRVRLRQWALNLRLCGAAASWLLLGQEGELLEVGAEDEEDVEGGVCDGGGEMLRLGLTEWLRGLVEEEGRQGVSLSDLHRVQAVLEVMRQVAAVPLRIPPVVLDPSAPARLVLSVTPKPRGILETTMGVGLMLGLEGSVLGAGGCRVVGVIMSVVVAGAAAGSGARTRCVGIADGEGQRERRYKLRCKPAGGACVRRVSRVVSCRAALTAHGHRVHKSLCAQESLSQIAR